VPVIYDRAGLLRVEQFVSFEHFNELLDAFGTSGGAFGGLDAVEDGVAVAAVEGLEEGVGGGVGVKSGLEVVGDGRFALGVVSDLPTAVFFGPFDFEQTGGLHFSGSDERFGFLAVDLGPDGFRPSGGEFLEPVGVVEAFFLAVYPAVAEGDF